MKDANVLDRSDISAIRSGISKSSGSNAHGRLIAGKTPAPAETGRGRDRLAEGVDVTNLTEPERSRKRLALDYLTRAVRDPWASPELLAERVHLAAEYGCTAAEIRAAWGDV